MRALNFESLNQALKVIEPIAQEIAPQALNEYKELYKEKSGNQEPIIMIYGMYSHGKSTLVNALLGKEAAKMDITPTTAAPDKYKWENADCILLDTPGISAKNEHTEIAETSAKTNELVVFVVESGSFEGNVVWNKIINLVQKGQKTCLIINDFDNCMDDEKRSERLKDEFRKHLQKAAEQAQLQDINIVEKIPLLFVNAKMALKGRLENKPQLVKFSGIYEVEKTLIEMVRSIDIDDTVSTLKRNLLQLISLCKISFATKSGNETLKLAEEQRSNIIAARDNAFRKIESKLSDSLDIHRSDIRSIYEQYSNNEAELKNAFSTVVESIASDIEETIKTQIEKAAKRVEELCAEYDRISVQLNPETMQGFSSADDFSILDTLKKQDWTNILKMCNWEELVKDSIVTVLQQLKEWFPSLLKGKGAKTFAKWAGNCTKILGPILTIGMTVYDIYGEFQAEEKAKEETQRRSQAISDAVETSVIRLKEAFMNQLSEIFEEIFDKVINEISEQVRKLQLQNSVDTKQLERLDSAEQLIEKMA